MLAARAIEDRLHDQTSGSPGYDLIPALRRVAVPSLVLHGEYDLVPVEVAARIAEAIAGARFVVLPGCGHFSYPEAPDAVARQIHDLFAAAPTAPPGPPATVRAASARAWAAVQSRDPVQGARTTGTRVGTVGRGRDAVETYRRQAAPAGVGLAQVSPGRDGESAVAQWVVRWGLRVPWVVGAQRRRLRGRVARRAVGRIDRQKRPRADLE